MELRWILQRTDSIADSTASVAHGGALLDSTVVESPLPDPVAAVVRFLFNVPQWLQIVGALAALVVLVVLLVLLWRRRAAIREWLTTRSRGVKLALAGGAAFVVLLLTGFGLASWNYIQHDNDFCSGCHVMTTAVDRFARSEHSKLQCHDCHRQSIFASARQLVMWVAERPEEIPPHAKVPTTICAECHIREQPDSVWQRISATAGHRVHLESDSSTLADVQCVTCHGLEVHRFAPVDSTCGQSECHTKTEIRLGKMRQQTTLHCVTCHQFTAPASEALAVDSARAVLVPGESQCFSCHEMRSALASFDPEREPHKAVCGTCHNPHEQETPQDAFATCANAGCHAQAEELTPFHRGITATKLADCASCHEAHTWSVQGDKCLDCHSDIFRDRPRRAQPSRAERDARRLGSRPVGAPVSREHQTPARLAAIQRQGAPTDPRSLGYEGPRPFSHARHREVQCTSCHATGEQHGALSVRTIRDCQSCHHAAENATRCATCHQTSELSGETRVPTRVELSVWRQPRERGLPFRHQWHRAVECATCHTTPVTLASAADCASCHTEHHQAQRECRLCHESGKPVHERTAHLGCAGSGCHTMAGTVPLRATRSVCLTCHQDLVNHRPGRVCANCHQVQWLTVRSGT